jgi:hypothetical protein
MESFARAVEIVLKASELRDGGYTPEVVLWDHAVRHSAAVAVTTLIRFRQVHEFVMISSVTLPLARELTSIFRKL